MLSVGVGEWLKEDFVCGIADFGVSEILNPTSEMSILRGSIFENKNLEVMSEVA